MQSLEPNILTPEDARFRDISIAHAALVAEVRQARVDFTSFVKLCVVDEAANPFKLEDMHLYWHRHVAWCWRKGYKAGIMAHWGGGKSAGLVVPLPAWLLGANPNLRIKIVCSSTELARERVEAVKTLITSPLYRRVFPHIKPGKSWKSSEFTVVRTGQMADQSLQAKGVFGKGVGKRADVLIFDDVVDQLNATVPEQRKKVREFISNTWLGRLTAGGKVLWISTPWNTDDATYHIMKRPNWCFLVQRVAEDMSYIEQEIHAADTNDYPREW